MVLYYNRSWPRSPVSGLHAGGFSYRYRAGLPDEQNKLYSAARAVLDSQINIARGTGAKVYFIPGEHAIESLDNF